MELGAVDLVRCNTFNADGGTGTSGFGLAPLNYLGGVGGMSILGGGGRFSGGNAVSPGAGGGGLGVKRIRPLLAPAGQALPVL